VNRKIDVLTKAKKLPKLPDSIVKPTIVTGMEALGRGHDLRKLDMFIQGMSQALGPEVLQQYVNKITSKEEPQLSVLRLMV
jgi:hypothetical protein